MYDQKYIRIDANCNDIKVGKIEDLVSEGLNEDEEIYKLSQVSDLGLVNFIKGFNRPLTVREQNILDSRNKKTIDITK